MKTLITCFQSAVYSFNNVIKTFSSSSPSPTDKKNKSIFCSMLQCPCCIRNDDDCNDENDTSEKNCQTTSILENDAKINSEEDYVNNNIEYREDDDDQEYSQEYSITTSNNQEHWYKAVERSLNMHIKKSNDTTENIEKISYTYHNNYENNHITIIPHYRQEYTWDCGVACMQMIIRWWWTSNQHICQDEDYETIFSLFSKQWMLDTIGTESIWTIDLIMLLEKFNQLILSKSDTNADEQQQSSIITTNSSPLSGSCCPQEENECVGQVRNQQGTNHAIRYLFCTTCFGVDISYNNFEYYKHAFTKDEVRVKELFTNAKQNHLPMLELDHLSLDQVIDLISHEDTVAIVLLDNSILSKKSFSDRSNIDDCAESFTGHYVILCGICFEQEKIKIAKEQENDSFDNESEYCMVIVNPGNDQAMEYIMPSHLDRSWRAKGTDQDIIFLKIGCRNS